MTVLTVICLTYNHKDFILQALESIKMQQTTFDFEVLIADDFSNDGSRELIIDFVEENKEKFLLIPSNENVGSSLNFMRACRLVKSKYIAYLDGDDFWIYKFKLQEQFDVLESDPSIAGCVHNAIRIDKYGNLLSSSYYLNKERLSLFDFYPYGVLCHSGSMFFRSIALKVLPKWVTYQTTDQILQLRIAQFGDFYFIDKTYSVHRSHSGGVWSMTSKLKKDIEQFKRILILYKYKAFKEYDEITVGVLARISYEIFVNEDKNVSIWMNFKYGFLHCYFKRPFSVKRIIFVFLKSLRVIFR